MCNVLRVSAFVALLFPIAVMVPAASAQVIGFGTNPQGNFAYSTGAALAGAVNPKSGLQIRVQPYGGSSTYIPLIDTGELEMGIANAIEAALAVKGDPMYSSRKNPNLRAVAVLVPFTSAYFVRKDSSIRTIADLKGKTVPGGWGSQAILINLSDAIFANSGLSTADFKILPVPNNLRGADDFAAGRADTFFFAIGGAKVKEIDASVGGVRILPIRDAPEAVAAMKRAVPQTYPLLVQPAPHTTGVTEPTWSLGYDMLVIASAKTSDDIVYRFTKAAHESKSELVASFAPLRAFEPAKMAKNVESVEFHPGAIKFYREAGQWPPKE